MRVFDLHNDLLTSNVQNKMQTYMSYSKKNYYILAIFRENYSFYDIEKVVEYYNLLKKENTFLAFEDIGYRDLNLDYLISLKPKYCSLTYNGENIYGYGVDYDKGLKDSGIRIAKILNNSGIKIDVAHLSLKGVKDLLGKIPIICTHTAVNDIREHKRNLPSYIIKEIIDNGGLVGITLVGYFLTENKTCTANDYFKHIDFLVQKYGTKGISIGSDFNGTDYLPKDLKTYENFENLKEIMLKNGYNIKDINAIFYKNAKNLFLNKKM